MEQIVLLPLNDSDVENEIPILENVKKMLLEDQAFVGVLPVKKEASPVRQSPKVLTKVESTDVSYSVEEFEGNPLECPFDLKSLSKPVQGYYEPDDLSGNYSNEGQYQPIAVESARTLLLQSFDVPKEKFHIYHCDATDPGRVVLLGQKIKEGSRGTFLANFPFESNVQRNDERISLEKQRRYQQALSGPGRIDFEVWSKYLLYFSKDEDSKKANSLVLECSWNDPRMVLEAPPTSTAKVKVKATVYPEAKDSIGSGLWRQLRQLKNHVEALTTRELVWISDGSGRSATDTLRSSITNSQRNAAKSLETTDGFKEICGAKGVGFFLDRENLDIIDIFWNGMLECASYEDLKSGLTYLLSCGREGKLNNVSAVGKTMLGRLILKSLRSNGIPALGELEPLELLVDSGLEKLKRDYMHAFTTTNLASKEKLLSVLPPTGSCPVFKDYAEATLKSLYRLHMSLEVTSLTLKNLQVPLARQPLIVDKTFSGITINGTTSVDAEFEVRANVLSELLKNENLEPWVWQSILKSKSELKDIDTSWCFSLAESCDEKTNNNAHEAVVKSSPKYSCLRMTYVKLKS